MLKSFIVHYSTLSSMESGKLHALHSTVQNVLQTSCTKSWKLHAPQCIINQVYEEWEVTGAFRWTALEPQASLWDHLSQPVQSLLWIGRIILLVAMTNGFCCCVLFLIGSHVFFIGYVFSCWSKWFQGCPFCESCFLNSAKVLYRKIPIYFYMVSSSVH